MRFLHLLRERSTPAIRHAMYEVSNHPKGTAYKYTNDSRVKLPPKQAPPVVSIPQSEKVRMKEKDMWSIINALMLG